MDQLLSLYERPVYRFGLRMCGSEDAARDVLQQTLVTAFKGLRGFRGEAALSTWLYQIARSFCIKARRRRVDEPEEMLPLDAGPALSLPSPGATPEEAAHARQIGEILQSAILALPESYREVLVLRDVEGLSAEEAAEIAGIEVGALKSRLHRARMELREHLSALLQPGGAKADAACPELAQELAAYAAEEIDQAACQKIEDHLQRCPRCMHACEDLKRTVSLCRRIPGDEVPSPIRSAVRTALLDLAKAAPGIHEPATGPRGSHLPEAVMYDRNYAHTKALPGVTQEQAIERARAALATEGFGVLTEIDVQATLKKKLNVDRKPYVILGACNPPLAHKALEADPGIGVLLPCNVDVFQGEDGVTYVQAVRPDVLFRLVENPALRPIAEEVDAKLRRVLSKV